MLAQPYFFSRTVEQRCSMGSQEEVIGHTALISAYLFQAFLHNVPSGCDLFLLSDPIYAVKCLVFYHGIPLRLHEEDMICSG